MMPATLPPPAALAPAAVREPSRATDDAVDDRFDRTLDRVAGRAEDEREVTRPDDGSVEEQADDVTDELHDDDDAGRTIGMPASPHPDDPGTHGRAQALASMPADVPARPVVAGTAHDARGSTRPDQAPAAAGVTTPDLAAPVASPLDPDVAATPVDPTPTGADPAPAGPSDVEAGADAAALPAPEATDPEGATTDPGDGEGASTTPHRPAPAAPAADDRRTSRPASTAVPPPAEGPAAERATGSGDHAPPAPARVDAPGSAAAEVLARLDVPAATGAAPGATTPAPAGPAPAAAPPVAQQLVGHVAPLVTGPDGTHELTIELRPAELGHVRLEVRVEEGVVSVRVHAEDPASRRLLAQSLGDLRSALAEAGIDAGSLDVGDPRGGHDARDARDARPGERTARGRADEVPAATRPDPARRPVPSTAVVDVLL